METHEYHHDPLKKQIFLHNSWLCSHVFPRKMKPEVVSNFRPTKNLQLFIKKSWIFFQPSKNLHGNFLQSSLGNEKNRGAFHQQIPHLPGQRRDICRSRPWTLSRSRDLPVLGGLRGPCAKGCLGMPRLQVRMGLENIGKTLENWENIGIIVGI